MGITGMDHHVLLGFRSERFAGESGYAFGLMAREGVEWCEAQGLKLGTGYEFKTQNSSIPRRHVNWKFLFADPVAATLFKVRFSDYL
jgi:hypothetical protein